jgi:hypothetical protein
LGSDGLWRANLAMRHAYMAGAHLMQVNVFITRRDGAVQNKLLVLPIDAKAAIPPEYRLGWIYYATTGTADRMFGQIDAATLEAQIATKGFAIVKPQASDRR